jgi:hypothetical protein
MFFQAKLLDLYQKPFMIISNLKAILHHFLGELNFRNGNITDFNLLDLHLIRTVPYSNAAHGPNSHKTWKARTNKGSNKAGIKLT